MFRQLRLYLAGAALVAAFAGGWYVNGLRLTKALETERRQVAEDARKRVEAAQEAAYQAELARDEARRKLAAYKPKVVERVRANPSGCDLPKPVADELREQVRAANDAIKAAVPRAARPA